MIWMTQPAWPSTMWQMYSSDYDTQASFYGIKKANAPLHVQMDLSDYTVAAVNTTLKQGKNQCSLPISNTGPERWPLHMTTTGLQMTPA